MEGNEVSAVEHGMSGCLRYGIISMAEGFVSWFLSSPLVLYCSDCRLLVFPLHSPLKVKGACSRSSCVLFYSGYGFASGFFLLFL
jgi:hypothetical protein